MRVPDLLTVAFIALKVAGDIDWSWVWVLAPSWIDLTVNVVLEVVLELINERKRKRADDFLRRLKEDREKRAKEKEK